jgi:hypothetical protein
VRVKGRPVGSAPGRWKKRLGNDCEDEWFVSGMKDWRVACDRWRWWCADLLATAAAAAATAAAAAAAAAGEG